MVTDSVVSTPATISKNQLKQQKRLEQFQEKKRQRKLTEKETKEKKKQQTSLSHAKLTNGPNAAQSDEAREERKRRRELEKIEYLQKCDNNFTIIIDCAFEDKHMERDLKSVERQIVRCYGVNRRHTHPVHLYLTGVGTSVSKHLDKLNFENWPGVYRHPSCYTVLPEFSTSAPALLAAEALETHTSPSSSSSTSHSNALLFSTAVGNLTTDTIDAEAWRSVQSNQSEEKDRLRRKQLVYLTSDGDETLEKLDISCAYIIGGIVDRNKHKGITYAKAKQQGLRTAKLPIREHLRLASTHVLTINHVFELLLEFAASSNWTATLQKVLPTRKGVQASGNLSFDDEDDDDQSHDQEDYNDGEEDERNLDFGR